MITPIRAQGFVVKPGTLKLMSRNHELKRVLEGAMAEGSIEASSVFSEGRHSAECILLKDSESFLAHRIRTVLTRLNAVIANVGHPKMQGTKPLDMPELIMQSDFSKLKPQRDVYATGICIV